MMFEGYFTQQDDVLENKHRRIAPTSIPTEEWAYFYALRANAYNFGAFSNTLGLIFTSSRLTHTTPGLI